MTTFIVGQAHKSPQFERRLLIEEAAGVSGFKHKRRLAELKLEATQANLLRVGDIVGEVRRQINSLKRQAAKARRYKRLRDEVLRLVRPEGGEELEGEYVDHESYDNASKLEDVAAIERHVRGSCAEVFDSFKRRMEHAKTMKEANL